VRGDESGGIESLKGFVGGNGDRTAEEAHGFGPNDFESSHALALKISLRFRHRVFRFCFLPIPNLTLRYEVSFSSTMEMNLA
jgi:hypothetical protein